MTHVDALIDLSLADLSRADLYPPSRCRVSRWVKEMPAKMVTLLIMGDIYRKRVKEGGDLPQMNLPLAHLPQVSLSQVNLPQVSLPQMNLPQVSLPQINLPQVNLPMIGLPLTLIAVAAVAPTVWLAGSSEGNTQLAPQVLPVETMALEGESSYEVSRTYSGEIVARRSSDLGFELAGTVIDLFGRRGRYGCGRCVSGCARHTRFVGAAATVRSAETSVTGSVCKN